jgi:pimeloyl-ACP methyl ester carboxylesterase
LDNKRKKIKNLRIYGKVPFNVAVIHGGPGAAGEMAPVARKLSIDYGVLEPLQTADSIVGQVNEMKMVLQEYGDTPLTLIGHSWGAWLGFIFASTYPIIVKKLILVGSGGFEDIYGEGIHETRENRLSVKDRIKLKALKDILNNSVGEKRTAAFMRLGALFSKADAYDPIKEKSEVIDYRIDIFENVWKEATELRRSGKLLDLGKRIKCPVVAIHGDHDPHPAEGVQKPLSVVLQNFRFILLKNCGHKPWSERQARDEFYQILHKELTTFETDAR